MYDKEFVYKALPLAHWHEMTVETEPKEPGMPGTQTDPRKANNATVMMTDIRIAWERCTWLSFEQRQCLMAISMFGTADLAAEFVDWSPGQVKLRAEQGAELLTLWLNSTHLDRMEWEEELGWSPELVTAGL